MRRQILKWIASSFAFGAASALGGNWAFTSQLMAANTVDLKDTLEKDLYARTPEQFEFIETVVLLVANKILSPKLVYSTFKWSLQYDKGRRFYYFEAAMRKRAKQQGVEI